MRGEKTAAVTLLEFKKEITESYTPEIEVVHVDSMFDVKTWMDPLQDISGHIYHHQFKIERNGEGRAILFYKKWSTSTEWLPKEEWKSQMAFQGASLTLPT